MEDALKGWTTSEENLTTCELANVGRLIEPVRMPDQHERRSSPIDGSREREPISIMVWLFVAAIFIVAVVLTLLMVKKHRERPVVVLSELSNDARKLGFALEAFDKLYGKYPDSTTIAPVLKSSGTRLTLGDDSSNAIFRQLMVSGIVTDESIFSANTGTLIQPDNDYDSNETMLAQGECAFAYLPGFDSSCDWNTPLAFGPVSPGTTTLDPQTFGGKAVVLKRDMSVICFPVSKSGKLMYGGMDLLDPRQPFWHGKPPDVKWPK